MMHCLFFFLFVGMHFSCSAEHSVPQENPEVSSQGRGHYKRHQGDSRHQHRLKKKQTVSDVVLGIPLAEKNAHTLLYRVSLKKKTSRHPHHSTPETKTMSGVTLETSHDQNAMKEQKAHKGVFLLPDVPSSEQGGSDDSSGDDNNDNENDDERKDDEEDALQNKKSHSEQRPKKR